jgi:hypothetical protein
MQYVAIRSVVGQEYSLLCLLSGIVDFCDVIPDHLLHSIFEALD